DEVVGERLDALQAQDVVRVWLAVGDDLAADHLLALEHVEVPPLRDQLLVLLPFLVRDDQAALALSLLTEADGSRELGEDRRILRPPRLEEVRDAGQTARDVARLRALLRQPRD